MLVVMVAGKFDPIHSGHIDHIKKARALGDKLIVITHRDDAVARCSKSGVCQIPLNDRMSVLGELRSVDEVMVAIDTDGTVAETIRYLKPNIFAKGGDRRSDADMPLKEIEACREVGCRIVYGIGGQLNESSKLKDKLKSGLKEAQLGRV